jgi:hypothetical protein
MDTPTATPIDDDTLRLVVAYVIAGAQYVVDGYRPNEFHHINATRDALLAHVTAAKD